MIHFMLRINPSKSRSVHVLYHFSFSNVHSPPTFAPSGALFLFNQKIDFVSLLHNDPRYRTNLPRDYPGR
jgi:hypothetical protein